MQIHNSQSKDSWALPCQYQRAQKKKASEEKAHLNIHYRSFFNKS